MKNSFIVALMVAICTACTAQKINVKNLNDLSGQSDQITRHMNEIAIFKEIRQKANYKFDKDEDGKAYVSGEGVTKDGAKVIFRVGASASAINGSFDISMEASGESCSGVNCTKCAFEKGGGCKCESIGSHLGGPPYCNHSVSN